MILLIIDGCPLSESERLKFFADLLREEQPKREPEKPSDWFIGVVGEWDEEPPALLRRQAG